MEAGSARSALDQWKESLRKGFRTVCALATSMLGLSIFEQAKSADVPYSRVRRRAEKLWPLWAH